MKRSRSFPRQERRQAVALFVVLSVIVVLGAFSAMVFTTKETAPVEQSFEKTQAEFLARGAQQHAILKCRLLPTEFYDAVSYSIGRNPYYKFALSIDGTSPGDTLNKGSPLSDRAADLNPGPMFFTGDPQIKVVDNPESPGNTLLQIDRGSDIEGSFGDRMHIFLDFFTYDVSTLFPNAADPSQSIVVVDSKPHFDQAFEEEGWRDPFIGNYKVQQLRILGLQGGRVNDRDTILLTTIGSVKRAGQISLVTQLSGAPKNLSPQRRVQRSSSDAGFGEFDTVFEGQDEFNTRVGSEDEGRGTNDVFDPSLEAASGRRTEIVTGVFFITRAALEK